MATQKFFVEGLEHADEGRIESSLQSRQGVLYASANHSDACVEIEFEDDVVTTRELTDVLASIGFEARLAG